MNYLSRFRAANPQFESTPDADLISALPQLLPDRFGNMAPAEVFANAMYEGNDINRFLNNDGRSQIRKGLSAGVDQLQALGGGVTAFAGDALGIDGMRDYGMEVYNRNMEEAGQSAGDVAGFTDIRTAEDAADWVMYTLGNLAPMMATTVGTGGVGGVVAAGGKKALQTAITREMAKGFTAKQAAEIAAKEAAKRYTQGTIAGAGATALGMGIGELYGETEDVGITAAHAPFYAIAEALPALRILDKFGPAGKTIKDGIAKRAAADIAIQGGLEGGTEAIQTLVEQHAAYWLETEGQSLLSNLSEVDTKQLIDASAAGFLGGTVMGGGARGVQRITKQDVAQEVEQEVRENGGDELDAQVAGLTAEREFESAQPQPEVSRQQFSEPADLSSLETPAMNRERDVQRGYEGIDGLITLSERMGFTDEAALLVTAKRVFRQADQARAEGNNDMASLYVRQGNDLYQRATDTNETIRQQAANLPVPYVFGGGVEGGQLAPSQQAPSQFNTFDQQPDPRRVTGTRGLLNNAGIVYGQEPGDITTARQQRTADDFSARYGQEGVTPFRRDALQGELDRSNELPPAQRPLGLPEGTGQIDLGRDTPQRTFTPVSSEYDGVGRNVVERQAQAQDALPQGNAARSITQEQIAAANQPDAIIGQQIDAEWTAFSPDSGTLRVPRAEMPQVKAEHRGALVNFLNARGIDHIQADIDPGQLKPTQLEFSPKKVQRARDYQGGDRSILVSADGHVVDGHHQWMAKRDSREPIKVIQLNAPIADLVPLLREFPSSEQDAGAGYPGAQSVSVSSNGKPFATERGAQASKVFRSMPNPEVLPVAGGFGVRSRDSQAVQQSQQIGQAEDRRIQQRSIDRRKSAREVNPNEDELLTAIAKEGGISRTEAEAQGVDPDLFKTRRGFFLVFNNGKNAKSVDQMAEALSQYGYVDRNYTVTELLDKIDQSLSGNEQYTPEGAVNRAQADYDAAMLEAEADAMEAGNYSDATVYMTPDGFTLEELAAAELVEALSNEIGDAEQAVLNSDKPIDIAIGALNNGQTESNAASQNDTRRRSADEVSRGAESQGRAIDGQLESQESGQNNQDLLASYTEAELAQQADQQRRTQEAESQSRQQAERRVQADAEVDTFNLTGSDRTADVAAAAGQNDMFGVNEIGAERLGDAQSESKNTGVAINEGVELYSGYERETGSLQVRQSNNPSLSEQGALDLFAATEVPAATAARQSRDNFSIRYKQSPAGAVRSAIDRIQTPSDAAHVLAPLRKHGQETMVALVTDVDGKVINLIRHTKGGKSASSVYPAELVAAIASTEDAASVWFGHNHPSGNLKPSSADYKITDVLLSVLDGTGISFQGHIIVAPGGEKATFFTDEGNSRNIPIRAGVRNRSIEITERVLRKRSVQSQPFITSPESARGVVQKIESDNALILLTHQHQVIGSISMSSEEMKALRSNGQVNRVFQALDETNASAVIIKADDEASATNVARFINNMRDIRVLDWFRPTASGFYISDANSSGRVNESAGPFFSQGRPGESTDVALSRDQVETAASRITTDWTNAPEMVTVASDLDLPADLQSYIDAQNARGKIDGVFHKDKFYLVADKIRTEADVERIVLHEALGHYGLRQLYGPALGMHMDRLFNRVGGYEGIQRLGKKYGFDLSSYWESSGDMSIAQRREMMADEMVAHIAGTGTIQPDLIQRIAHLIREGLRKIMAGTRFAERLDQMTDVEVLRIVAAARQAVTKGESQITVLTHDPRFVRDFQKAVYGDEARFSRADQTQSKAFRNWFGDSKVVDDNGDPLVVYHGSPDVRGIIDGGFASSPLRGDVFFFTDNPSVANTYADDSRALDYQNAEPNTIPLYLSMKNPYVVDAKGARWRNTERHIQEAREGGHDGIIIKNSRDEYNNTGNGGVKSTIYAVFTPTQIKSAADGNLISRVDGVDLGDISNQGTFDPSNPDIRFSRVPDDAPVIETDGGPIAKGKTLKEMALRAREYAKKNFAGKTVRNENRGDDITIPMSGVKHTIQRAKEPLLRTIAVTPEILERGVYIGSRPDKSNSDLIKAVHYYAAKVNLSGELHDVVAVVKERIDGSWYYDHSIERKTDGSTDPGSNSGVLPSAETNDTASNQSIASETADTSNSDTRFSRVPSAEFGVPTEKMADVIVRKLQDKFKVLKDVQDNIRKQGKQINEDADAYLAEELFHGKTAEDLDVITKTMVEPFAKLLAKHKIDQADLDLYLMAKHARERNDHIASINPDMPYGGSGLTNAQADKILNDVASSGKQAKYDEIAQVVYDMLANRRTILKENGLIDPTEVDAWEGKYQHYVPLKGWAANEKQDGRPRSGRGLSIGGKETKRALGRNSQAASPSSYAIVDLTESIVRKRKNEVGNAFMNLVEQNPDKGYWQVFSDENPETNRTIRKRKDEDGNAVEEVVEQVVPMAMMSDRYFTTKKDGKTYYIKLEDQRLLNAMNNVGPESHNAFTRTMGTVTRFMSAMNTSYNPEFVVGNFARDVQTAILNLTAEQSRDGGKAEGQKIATQTVKDIPKAMRAVYRGLRGKKATNPEWQQWYDEFRQDGAQTGYYDMKDIDGQIKDVERMVQIAQGGFVGGFHRWRKAGAKAVEDLNSAVENAVRLSAYVNARKAGISKAQSASLAKNLTVNFNRRGEMGTMMNSLYMFFNASIQGIAQFGRTMFGLKGNKEDPVWKRLTTAQKLAVGIATGAYALAQANRMAAGEDDDGENWYDKVPDYVRERNLVFMKSLFGGPQDGSYWKIPLPYGYNIFAIFGENAQAVTSGNRSIGRTATELSMGVMGSFNPIGFVDSNSFSAGVIRNITPSIGKPIADLVANENFMGTSIYNENFPFGTPKPDSQLSRRSTPATYKAIAEWLNDVSGGSQWRSGHIDVNPDAMRYMVDYFTGGAGAFFTSKAPDHAIRFATGVETEPHRKVFLSRLNGRVLPYEDQSQFYDRRDEINQINEELKTLRGREKTDFFRDNRDRLALRPLIRTTENEMKALRRRRDAVQSDTSLSARERDQRLKEVEALMKASVDRFNRRYNAL